jgi:hypothetical protein
MIHCCDKVFAGPTYTFPDGRQEYGKPPFITVRFLRGRSDGAHTPEWRHAYYPAAALRLTLAIRRSDPLDKLLKEAAAQA